MRREGGKGEVRREGGKGEVRREGVGEGRRCNDNCVSVCVCLCIGVVC